MFYKYGTYTHAANETSATFIRTGIYEEGARAGYREEWRLRGLLMAANTTALQVLIDAMEAAYAEDGQTIQLLDTDGTTVLREMVSTDSTTGTMVVEGPSYPDGGEKNNEYGTYRTYEILVAAEYTGDDDPDNTLPDDTIIWMETLTITGTGGSQFVLVPILNGIWPVQRLRAATSVHAVQQGQAVGRTSYPSPPGPLFGGWEHVEQRVISRGPVKRAGGGANTKFVEWPVSWTYVHESPTALGGLPNTPP